MTEIERFFGDAATGKSASDTKIGHRKRIVVQGGDGAARKVFRDLSAVFSFAVRREIVEVNPCEKAVVRKTDNRRERFLSIDEIKRLGKALDVLGMEGMMPHRLHHTVDAIATSSGEALALTGTILGHANMRSTMIYAQVEMDPSKLAANRVGAVLADALVGG